MVLTGRIFIISLLTCLWGSTSAQFCGTEFRGDVELLQAEASRIQKSGNSLKSQEIQYVALTVFNVESLGANLPLEVDKLYEGLDFANRYYAPAGIQFFICGSPRTLLGNTSYTYSESRRLLSQVHNIPNTVNIYYVDEVFAADLVIGGFSSFPWEQDQLIVIDKSFIANSLSSGGILAHELGHHFGLFHTHETFMGTEFVNGSNCEIAGDLICDTNADFNLSTGGLEGCNYVGNFVDVNGDFYNPDPRNIMSYAPSTCLSRITELQADRVNFYYEQEFSDYLQDCDFYPDLSVNSDITDISIFSGQEIQLDLNLGNQNSNNESVQAEVLFSITDENEVSNFLIHTEEVLIQESEEPITTTINFNLPISFGSGEYFMTIRINAIDEIIERDERNNFYDLNVKIDNAQFGDFLIFPNPAIDFMTLFLRDENFSGRVSMTISDVKGSIRYTEDGFRERDEEFIRKFDVSQLDTGLYILSLEFQFGGKKSLIFYTGN